MAKKKTAKKKPASKTAVKRASAKKKTAKKAAPKRSAKKPAMKRATKRAAKRPAKKAALTPSKLTVERVNVRPAARIARVDIRLSAKSPMAPASFRPTPTVGVLLPPPNREE